MAGEQTFPPVPECPVCERLGACCGADQRAMQAERAWIVAFMRHSGQYSYAARASFPSFHVISPIDGKRIDCITPVDLDHLATAIERGEHVK